MRTQSLVLTVLLLAIAPQVLAQLTARPSITEARDMALPKPPAVVSKADHVQQAVDHLRLAGFNELAKMVQEHSERHADQIQLARLRKELHNLREQIDRLQSEINEFAIKGTPKSDDPQQVLVELKVLELSRTKMRELGFDIGKSGFGQLLVTPVKDSEWSHGQFALGLLDQREKSEQIMESLRQAGVLKTLAEPTIVTLMGRPASFNSGGEFPVPVVQGDGEVAIEYRQFGTRVDLLTHPLGNQKLRLEIRLVISEVDPSRSITIGDVTVPGVRVRAVDTAVEMASGQTLVIGGIVQKTKSPNDASDESSNETELIVLASPTLVGATSGEKKTSPAVRTGRKPQSRSNAIKR